MTGYGKAEAFYGGKKIHAEVKSLNSKSLDLSARLASIYREKEMEVRRLVAEKLIRGKVELNVWIERQETRPSATINASAVSSYLEQLATINAQHHLSLPEKHVWEVLVRLPDITQPEAAEVLTDEEWGVALQVMDEALAQLIEFRRQEGEALQHKFEEKVTNIGRLLESLEPYEKGRTEKIRQKLEARLAELVGVDYDRNRLEQELIYYIEKLDISEEKQRLTNHLRYFRETMGLEPGQGKKLGFIAQEMGREINTTGSKSNQAEMQNIVVRMKDELEQIKEQVLNVL